MKDHSQFTLNGKLTVHIAFVMGWYASLWRGWYMWREVHGEDIMISRQWQNKFQCKSIETILQRQGDGKCKSRETILQCQDNGKTMSLKEYWDHIAMLNHNVKTLSLQVFRDHVPLLR